MFQRKTALVIAFGMAACFVAIDLLEAQRPGRRPFQRRRDRQRAADKLKVGDEAPDFTLKTIDGKSEVTLSSFKGKKPVMLVFGSYT